MTDKLTLNNGLLLKCSRIVIPSALRKTFQHDLHEEHISISKCQPMARSLIYWPGTVRDMEDYIKWCHTYINLLPIIPAEPAKNENIPQDLQKKIGTDFMDWDNKRYLLMIDYFSKHPSLFQMSLTNATAVMDHLTAICLEGIPLEIFTDNPLTPRNDTNSQINVASNISLQAHTPLSSKA